MIFRKIVKEVDLSQFPKGSRSAIREATLKMLEIRVPGAVGVGTSPRKTLYANVRKVGKQYEVIVG